MKKTDNKCVLCGHDNGKWGNNAMPLADGRCCDVCNDMKVIPARIRLITFNSALATYRKQKGELK